MKIKLKIPVSWSKACAHRLKDNPKLLKKKKTKWSLMVFVTLFKNQGKFRQVKTLLKLT